MDIHGVAERVAGDARGEYDDALAEEVQELRDKVGIPPGWAALLNCRCPARI
jgi:hypothetical protein